MIWLSATPKGTKGSLKVKQKQRLSIVFIHYDVTIKTFIKILLFNARDHKLKQRINAGTALKKILFSSYEYILYPKTRLF